MTKPNVTCILDTRLSILIWSRMLLDSNFMPRNEQIVRGHRFGTYLGVFILFGLSSYYTLFLLNFQPAQQRTRLHFIHSKTRSFVHFIPITINQIITQSLSSDSDSIPRRFFSLSTIFFNVVDIAAPRIHANTWRIPGTMGTVIMID